MSSRFWGEEKEKDAHYDVYLKKVRYQRQSNDFALTSIDAKTSRLHALTQKCFASASADGDRLNWETVKVKVLKAATLEKWVRHLILQDDEGVRSSRFELFFETYRAIAKPYDVVQIILSELTASFCDRNTNGNFTQFERNLKFWSDILHRWLDHYPEDFKEHPKYPCLQRLIEFSRRRCHPLGCLVDKAIQLRDKFCKELSFPEIKSEIWDNYALISAGNESSVNAFTGCQTDFCHLDPLYIAEQLTCIDADLFRSLIPYQCQSCFWSSRNKKGSSDRVYTVRATVKQFNAVSQRVMSSVVCSESQKPSYRAKVISCWIAVAQELRLLKNFSSLKAVLSALQSEPVHRLRNVWSHVPSASVQLFEELSQIFDERDNCLQVRRLLVKEGTSKTAYDLESCAKSRSRTKLDVRGTVPYLGTFLTDLAMVDAAHPDYISGLINIDKRRREYEIIWQLKLIQHNAKFYHLQMDSKFSLWFNSRTAFDEKTCYEISCSIYSAEPQAAVTPFKRGFAPNTVTKCAFGNLDDSSFSSCKDDVHHNRANIAHQNSAFTLLNHSPLYRPGYFGSQSFLSSWFADLDKDLFSSPEGDMSKSSSSLSLLNYSSPESYIVRVVLDRSLQPDGYETVYKCVKLDNSDKTKTLVLKAMSKHNINGDPSDYCISQLLPDGGELLLPDKANAFYASTQCDDRIYILRRRCDVPSATLRINKNKKKYRGLTHWSSLGVL